MKMIEAKIENCNTFSFQCKRVRIILTHCPFLKYYDYSDMCSIENKKINNINKLPSWCPFEDHKEEVEGKEEEMNKFFGITEDDTVAHRGDRP